MYHARYTVITLLITLLCAWITQTNAGGCGIETMLELNFQYVDPYDKIAYLDEFEVDISVYIMTPKGAKWKILDFASAENGILTKKLSLPEEVIITGGKYQVKLDFTFSNDFVSIVTTGVSLREILCYFLSFEVSIKPPPTEPDTPPDPNDFIVKNIAEAVCDNGHNAVAAARNFAEFTKVAKWVESALGQGRYDPISVQIGNIAGLAAAGDFSMVSGPEATQPNYLISQNGFFHLKPNAPPPYIRLQDYAAGDPILIYHEYAHYVMFNLNKKRQVIKRTSGGHSYCLITSSEEAFMEGYAEAFSLIAWSEILRAKQEKEDPNNHEPDWVVTVDHNTQVEYYECEKNHDMLQEEGRIAAALYDFWDANDDPNDSGYQFTSENGVIGIPDVGDYNNGQQLTAKEIFVDPFTASEDPIGDFIEYVDRLRDIITGDRNVKMNNILTYSYYIL